MGAPFTGQAPGKLILCGEHAVVEGYWAIAAALPRLTTVSLTPRPGPTGLAAAPDRLETTDQRLLPALLTVLPAEGFEIAIRSAIPIGCGLGSSAALAVAVLRALAAAEGRAIGFEEVHRRGFLVERAFHGNPSGVDHAVSALGGLVRYRRVSGSGTVEIEPLKLTAPLTLVVVNTGRPAFTTAEMVARVRARRSDQELAAIGAIVDRIAVLMAGERGAEAGGSSLDLEAIGGLLGENQEVLRGIGVSTPELDRACDVMWRAGALGAKLAGAGGGGVAFGLCTPGTAPAIETAASAAGFSAWIVNVG